jgi:hypothetical protein
MKLSLLTEGNYVTYTVRIDRLVDDKITGTTRYEPYDNFSTEIEKDAKNPEGQALRNSRHRVAKRLGISHDDVQRDYRATIVSPRSEKRTLRPRKIEKRNILCRACGQWNEPSPLGDICIHCNKDT